MEIGDRVKIIDVRHLTNKNVKFGDVGKIVAFKDMQYFTSIGVEFDKNIGGHDCEENGKKGHCLWLRAKYIRALGENKC